MWGGTPACFPSMEYGVKSCSTRTPQVVIEQLIRIFYKENQLYSETYYTNVLLTRTLHLYVGQSTTREFKIGNFFLPY